jgi:hypothetical protein
MFERTWSGGAVVIRFGGLGGGGAANEDFTTIWSDDAILSDKI